MEKDIDNVFEHEDLIKATYSDRMPIVPKQAGSLVSGLDVELPSDVKLKIDRFAKHLDARIEMAAAAGGDQGGKNFRGTQKYTPKVFSALRNQVPQQAKTEVWCILNCLLSREKEGENMYTKVPFKCLLGSASHGIGVQIWTS